MLVVTRSGILSNTLPVAITGTALAINQDVKALIPSEGISAEYVAHALRRFSTQILRECTKSGTTVPSILTRRLEAFSIPVAPSPEQVRVVTRIGSLLARTASAKEAVGTLSALLARYRAAILEAAYRGDATRTWRHRHASELDPQLLIEPIAAARQAEGQAVTLASTELADAFALRSGVPWRFLTLESACDPTRSITYGVIQTGDDTEHGVPTVRAGDIKNFRVELMSLKKIRRELSDRYPRTLLRGGEVLISIRGTTGNVAVVPPEMTGMNVSREVAVIPLLPGLDPAYVAYALASPAGQTIITQQVKGVAQSGINLVDLRSFPLPIPSHAEQREIVRFVNGALRRIEVLCARAEGLGHSLDELAAAVLRKAFRGELTPQNPDNESAAVLVQRSRTARAAAAAQPRRRPRRTAKSQGNLFRKQNVTRARKDVEADHLRSIITQASARSLPVKELYLRADMEVDEFYKQLAMEVALGQIRQSADKARLEMADAA